VRERIGTDRAAVDDGSQRAPARAGARAITASAPASRAASVSSTEPHWWIQIFEVRRFGLPQKVTTTLRNQYD
jgi:hypothetical protein